MATQEIDVIGNAITATEKEIAGSAWDDEERFALDETGDRSQEGMGDGLEGQREDDEDDETEVETEEEELPEGETEAEVREPPEGEKPPLAADDGKPAVKPNGKDPTVPPAVHRQATERARAAEAERETLRAQLETERRERAAERARMEGYLLAQRQQQQPPQQRQQQPQVPDMFEDPQGYHDHMRREFQSELAARDQRIDNMRVEQSMALAHRLDKESFEKAWGSLQQLDPNNPDARQVVQRIYASADPGEALVSWHKRNETLREVGDDPAAYRERLATETREALMKDPEFRRQLLEDLRAEANGSNGGQQRTVTRLPPSIGRVPGGSSTRGEDYVDDTDGAVFGSAFKD
jgi:hypothetical protein